MKNFSSSLKTDLYELTMANAIFNSPISDKQAIFETFARNLPDGRRYGIIGGTNRLLEEIKNFTILKNKKSFSIDIFIF